MARDEYQQTLNALREDVVALGETVSERLETVTVALERSDYARARDVVEGDLEIDEAVQRLEARCIKLFGREGPLAGDLRFVAATFKILTDVERIADLATNLGAYVYAADSDYAPTESIADVARVAREMVDEAIGAYAEGDAEACHNVAARDDELDGLCERVAAGIVRDLVEESPTDEALERGLNEVTHLLLTVRDVERVGDHAVNIAARTLYMVENADTLLY